MKLFHKLVRSKVAIVILVILIVINLISILNHVKVADTMAEQSFTWIDFHVNQSAMKRAIQLDIESHNTAHPINWIDMLAYLGAKYGGNFKRYQSKDLTQLYEKCKEGTSVKQLAQDNHLGNFDYYLSAYNAVLGGLVGNYLLQLKDESDEWNENIQTEYGIKAYFPIAEGFGFSHYDDFGSSRSFGFRRTHQGHDMFGQIGTPIVAVESGIVETLGWNQYGGWRIGIRSLDNQRYYYYAHLRKDHPYHSDTQEGAFVQAGDVIGYLGMTGYSSKENVNGMNHPHLHFGMQIIPEGCERECKAEIWINTYEIIKILQQHKSTVMRNEETKEYNRKYKYLDIDLLT